MDLSTAQAASVLAAKIAGVQALLDQVTLAVKENWPVTVLKAAAPAEGSSLAAGTAIDLLPAGPADAPNSALALSTAQATYQAQLDALNKQLAAL